MIFNLAGITLPTINYRPGLKIIFKNLIHYRFEQKKIIHSIIEDEDNELIIFRLNKLGGPKKSTMKRCVLMRIFSFHILKNYRGHRYLRNMPMYGQRTWSNACTAYRCNILYKPLILRRGRTFYGNLQPIEIFTAYMAEYVNQKWKETWTKQWEEARDFRILHRKKNTYLRWICILCLKVTLLQENAWQL